MRKKLARAMTLVLASTGLMVASVTATSPAFAGCAPRDVYSVSNAVHNYKDLVPYVSAPGGHTLSITISAGASVSATFSGALEVDESAIIASAKQTFGVAFSMTLSAGISYADQWKVPSTWKSGQLHAGADRKSFKWKYETLEPTCTWYVYRSGTSNSPYHIPAFWDVNAS